MTRGRSQTAIMAEVSSHLITSRLLVLQSKRLMLNSVQRRLDDNASARLHDQLEKLRQEAELAQHSYRSCMLNFGTADTSDYWLIAYSRLIEMGNALALKLRETSKVLPVSERYEVSADVEMLERIVATWTQSLRMAMAEAVA